MITVLENVKWFEKSWFFCISKAFSVKLCLPFPAATIEFDMWTFFDILLKHQQKVLLVSVPQIECKGFYKTPKTSQNVIYSFEAGLACTYIEMTHFFSNGRKKLLPTHFCPPAKGHSRKWISLTLHFILLLFAPEWSYFKIIIPDTVMNSEANCLNVSDPRCSSPSSLIN